MPRSLFLLLLLTLATVRLLPAAESADPLAGWRKGVKITPVSPTRFATPHAISASY